MDWIDFFKFSDLINFTTNEYIRIGDTIFN